MLASPSFFAVGFAAVCLSILFRLLTKYRLAISSIIWRPPNNIEADPREISKKRSTIDGSVYLTYIGWKPVVALAGREACAEFYSKVKFVIRKRALDLGSLFDRFIGDCLGALTGADWLLVKRAFQSAMLKMQSEECVRIMHNEITRWQRRVLDPLAESGKSVDAVDLVGDINQRVIQAIFFGEQFVEQHEATLCKLTAMSSQIVTEVFFNPLAQTWLYRFLPTATNRKLAAFQSELAHLVALYDAQDEKTRKKGVLSLVRRDKLSPDQLLHTLAEIAFVNLDVSIPATAWLLVHLSLHPDTLHTEYPTNFTEEAGRENCGDDNVLNFVKESARMAPIHYLSTQQLSDSELFGYPAGTSYSIDVISINRDANVWTNPDIFDPGRFDGENGQQDFGFMRFGMGPRKCPGRHLTDILLSAILARCSKRFVLHMVSDKIKSSDDVPLHAGPFIGPRCEISVKWKPVLVGCHNFGHMPIYSGVSVIPTSPFRDPSKTIAFLSILAKSGQPVVVILADTLNRFNVKAFETKSTKKATQFGEQLSEELFGNLTKAMQSLPDEQSQQRIQLWRMSDVETDPSYQHQLATFRSYYEQEGRFRDLLFASADRYIKHRRRSFSHSDPRFGYVAEFILGELPILVCGVKQKDSGIHCKQLVYSATRDHLKVFDQPRHGSVFAFADRLIEDEEFEPLRRQLGRVAESGQVLLPM